MRVLAIGAHPDDVEILCSGTLFKSKRRGDKVSICVLTDGSAGHREIGAEKLKEIRRKESEDAVSFLGAKLYWLGLKDEMLFDDENSRLKLIEVIRQVKPEVILCPAQNDYHQDHQAGFKLSFSASFIASLKNITTNSKALSYVPALYEMDTIAGIGFEPMIYVDISGSLTSKLRMLSFHKSQVKWLKDHDGIDILDLVETQARFRGYQSGVSYAEGFRLVKRWGAISGGCFFAEE